jgi:ankyrin repeat protein
LIDAIFHRDFPRAQDILLENPLEAQAVDTSGWSPLHWACVQAHAPLELIELILLAWPQAITLQDRYGCTPLHDACLYNRSDIVHFLIQTHTGCEHMTNAKGRTPLKHLCWYYRVKIQNVLKDTHNKLVDATELIQNENLTALWCNATLLISAVSHEDTSSRNLLHAACALGDACPMELLQLILKAAPYFPLQTDNYGNLPLHVAAIHSSSSVVKLLCQHHPWTAQARNSQGSLPLHLAVAQSLQPAVDELLQVYPESIQVADGATRLMPFMLAASCHRVELSMQLLQRCPELSSPRPQASKPKRPRSCCCCDVEEEVCQPRHKQPRLACGA